MEQPSDLGIWRFFPPRALRPLDVLEGSVKLCELLPCDLVACLGLGLFRAWDRDRGVSSTKIVSFRKKFWKGFVKFGKVLAFFLYSVRSFKPKESRFLIHVTVRKWAFLHLARFRQTFKVYVKL